MPQDRLFIPLYPNKTSQKAWRIFRVGFLFGVGALVGCLLYQIVRYPQQIVLSGAPDDIIELRVLKTPQTVAFVLEEEGMATLFPAAPFTLREALLTSRTGITLYLSEGGVFGYTTDGSVPTEALQAFGLTTTSSEKLTFVSSVPSEQRAVTLTSTFRPRFITRRRLDGYIVQPGVEKYFSFTLRDSTISLSKLPLLHKPEVPLTLPATATALASFSATPEQLSFLADYDIPLVYQGFSKIYDHIHAHGLSLLLGKDALGLSAHFATPRGELETQDAAAFAKEAVEIPTLFLTGEDEVDFRPRNPGVVAITAEKDLSFITATNDPYVVSIALSPDTLAANTRVIEAGSVGNIAQELCGVRTLAYIRPQALYDLLPSTHLLQATTFATILEHAEAVATHRSATYICFSRE